MTVFEELKEMMAAAFECGCLLHDTELFGPCEYVPTPDWLNWPHINMHGDPLLSEYQG